MKNEVFTKLNKETFKRTMEVEREDVFTLSQLQQEKKDLEEQINPLQKRLDEINHILEKIKAVK